MQAVDQNAGAPQPIGVQAPHRSERVLTLQRVHGPRRPEQSRFAAKGLEAVRRPERASLRNQARAGLISQAGCAPPLPRPPALGVLGQNSDIPMGQYVALGVSFAVFRWRRRGATGFFSWRSWRMASASSWLVCSNDPRLHRPCTGARAGCPAGHGGMRGCPCCPCTCGGHVRVSNDESCERLRRQVGTLPDLLHTVVDHVLSD